METEKLIAALHKYTYWLGQDGHESHDIHPPICDEAADALERLTADNDEKDTEIERLKKHVEDLRLDYCDSLADRDRLQAELDAAVEDLKIASDCATCNMRGEKRFSACAPLFVGDEQSCKNYKWRGTDMKEA